MTKKDRYAVIGNPVAHSKSPEIHTLFAEQTGEPVEYTRLLSQIDAFSETVVSFMADGGKGLNVTVPFKFDAFGFATVKTDRALAAGAVNTLKFDAGVVYGDNTDGAGLVWDIRENLKTPLKGARILMLGAGGAAAGVTLPLLSEKPACLHIANRTASRAERLAESFAKDAPCEILGFGYGKEGSGYDIVINATSAGLTGERPDVNPRVFASGTLAYDMVYGDKPTAFMVFAAAAGARTKDGFGMLVEQAAESFLFWRGVRPDTAPVFKHFKR